MITVFFIIYIIITDINIKNISVFIFKYNYFIEICQIYQKIKYYMIKLN